MNTQTVGEEQARGYCAGGVTHTRGGRTVETQRFSHHQHGEQQLAYFVVGTAGGGGGGRRGEGHALRIVSLVADIGTRGGEHGRRHALLVQGPLAAVQPEVVLFIVSVARGVSRNLVLIAIAGHQRSLTPGLSREWSIHRLVGGQGRGGGGEREFRGQRTALMTRRVLLLMLMTVMVSDVIGSPSSSQLASLMVLLVLPVVLVLMA